MRVALAAVLFSEPDLLLLDEPTNYLDLEGTMWLENYVSKYPHTVLLISHDRDLLNRAVNSIVHLDQKKMTFWRGGYDSSNVSSPSSRSCRRRDASSRRRRASICSPSSTASAPRPPRHARRSRASRRWRR
jgi:ATPase subunit of ABC transporter with duplicated ATPase domains